MDLSWHALSPGCRLESTAMLKSKDGDVSTHALKKNTTETQRSRAQLQKGQTTPAKLPLQN